MLPLSDYPRIAIAGGPRTGKTTLAVQIAGDREVLHTDDLIGAYEWSELSAEVVRRCREKERFVVEGVRTAHALRKGLEVDIVIWLAEARTERTPGQESMAKAVATVFGQWRESNEAASLPTPVVLNSWIVNQIERI